MKPQLVIKQVTFLLLHQSCSLFDERVHQRDLPFLSTQYYRLAGGCFDYGDDHWIRVRFGVTAISGRPVELGIQLQHTKFFGRRHRLMNNLNARKHTRATAIKRQAPYLGRSYRSPSASSASREISKISSFCALLVCSLIPFLPVGELGPSYLLPGLSLISL